jgi:nucleotide-binding universal stress UspA family protein
MIHKILAAVDGSEHSAKAVEYAGDIALKYAGELFLIYVISKAEIPEDFLKYVEVERIDETPESLLFSMVADEVLKNAEKQARP